MTIHGGQDVVYAGSEEDVLVNVEQSTGKNVPSSLADGPSVSAAADARRSPLKRTWSGSEFSHTVNIFEKPYASIADLYDIGSVLGWGQYGCVRACTHRGLGEKFAVKVIIKSSLTTPRMVELVQQEVAAMQAITDQPAVASLRDVLEDTRHVCLVMELCQGGDLFDRIKDLGHYSESDAATVCASLAEVLTHCRSRGVVHRDLKPENILLCSRSSRTDIRVADFGASAFVKPGERLSTLAGSIFYVAPEVIAGDYNWEADIWSAGVVLYVLLCGRPPFPGRDEGRVMAAIQGGCVDLAWGPWLHISEEAKDLVRRMLTLDPVLRITPQEILEHRWIRNHVLPSAVPSRPAAAHHRSSSVGHSHASPGGSGPPQSALPFPQSTSPSGRFRRSRRLLAPSSPEQRRNQQQVNAAVG
eukprot:jgi/Mesen1/8037/ME000428S07242